MKFAGHELIITNKSGFKVRGEIIEIVAQHDADNSTDITLRTAQHHDAWLDFGQYAAVLVTPEETRNGTYEVWSLTLASNEDVILSGRFKTQARRIRRQ